MSNVKNMKDMNRYGWIVVALAAFILAFSFVVFLVAWGLWQAVLTMFIFAFIVAIVAKGQWLLDKAAER